MNTEWKRRRLWRRERQSKYWCSLLDFLKHLVTSCRARSAQQPPKKIDKSTSIFLVFKLVREMEF